jgi:hypothetical protein
VKRSVTRGTLILLLGAAALLLLVGRALAGDPLDEAQQKLAAFLTRTGNMAMLLLPGAGGVAVTVLAIKRAVAKAAGEEESMVRASNQIGEVLKYTAIGSGASLLVSIAGSILR